MILPVAENFNSAIVACIANADPKSSMCCLSSEMTAAALLSREFGETANS